LDGGKLLLVFAFSLKKTRVAIILLLHADDRDFMPLVFFLITFQSNNILLPTLEGQYIIKNLSIISAALVLGGEINRSKTKRNFC
jgi:hypothetical protein